MTGDPDFTQILTQQSSVKSQTISRLTNLRTTPIKQVPLVQPLRVIKTPEDGVGVHAAPPSDNPNGIVGLS
jgi:hypothetical protein